MEIVVVNVIKSELGSAGTGTHKEKEKVNEKEKIKRGRDT